MDKGHLHIIGIPNINLLTRETLKFDNFILQIHVSSVIYISKVLESLHVHYLSSTWINIYLNPNLTKFNCILAS